VSKVGESGERWDCILVSRLILSLFDAAAAVVVDDADGLALLYYGRGSLITVRCTNLMQRPSSDR